MLNFLLVYDVQTNQNHFPLTNNCFNIPLNRQLCNEVISCGILRNQQILARNNTTTFPRHAKSLSSWLKIILHEKNIFDKEKFFKINQSQCIQQH